MTEMELGDRAEQEQAGREEEQNEAREQVSWFQNLSAVGLTHA
jgi:hypothetical protein